MPPQTKPLSTTPETITAPSISATEIIDEGEGDVEILELHNVVGVHKLHFDKPNQPGSEVYTKQTVLSMNKSKKFNISGAITTSMVTP